MRLPCRKHDAWWKSWAANNPDKDHDRYAEVAKATCPRCEAEPVQSVAEEPKR